MEPNPLVDRPGNQEVELALYVCRPGVRHGIKPGIVLAREVRALREELRRAQSLATKLALENARLRADVLTLQHELNREKP